MLNQIKRLRGSLTLPGDKSISHRALLFAAIGTGQSRLHGLGTGEDIQRTAACLQQLGVAISRDGAVTTVDSPGFGHWLPPAQPLDCGNSGTTMRLLAGLLAAHPGLRATLDGDASLRQRPMARVVAPLLAMGAQIAAADGKPPLHVVGHALHGAVHVLPVASAQVKSALLLAGLFAVGETVVVEPLPSRDHTERLLAALGVPLRSLGTRHAIDGHGPQAALPPLGDLQVPGDPSSAAFVLVAAVLHPDAAVTVRQVAHNPTRSGYLQVLARMGAVVRAQALAPEGGEPVAELHAHSAPLQATDIAASEVPTLIDEVPILALAAAAAQGTSHFHGLAELRVKESDRLAAIVRLLDALGVATAHGGDWLTIHGCGSARAFSGRGSARAFSGRGGTFRPGLDHRMAMTAAIANLCGASALEISGFSEAVASSWPDFAHAITGLAA